MTNPYAEAGRDGVETRDGPRPAAEITWSLMHPTPLDVGYMRTVVEKARHYTVDSFELCAECHSSTSGGLDGLLLYEEYPEAARTINRAIIEVNRDRLRRILRLAHDSGRPVYYWHREVVVPRGLLRDCPALLDGNGEFDLLGAPYADLLRYKIDRALAAVPELDGVVLTLTEADYSVIHNSNRERYPPARVVAAISGLFAAELKRRGKRFILRSFGSIAQDYEDILAGAALVAREQPLEIETKITPYDFSPFLPDNPFLRHLPNTALGAECDCLGEFLSAGNLPAENVEHIVRYVRAGQAAAVERFAIRIDRWNKNAFDAVPLNYYAYSRALADGAATAASIRRDWAERAYPPALRAAFADMDARSFEFIRRAHFIDGHVIFHGFPVKPNLQYLKSGGILACFTNGVSLRHKAGAWGILAGKNTPGREAILREKDEAVAMADGEGDRLARLPRLPGTEAEFSRRERLWGNARVASRALRGLVRALAAYFDDMEAAREAAPALHAVLGEELDALTSFYRSVPACDVPALRHFYLDGLAACLRTLPGEYRAEFAAHRKFGAGTGVMDYALCGSVTGVWRVGQYTHASFSRTVGGLPLAVAGNPVFPNGFIEFELKRPAGGGQAVIHGAPGFGPPEFAATLDGVRAVCRWDAAGRCELPVRPGSDPVTLRLEKAGGAAYPGFHAVSVIAGG